MRLPKSFYRTILPKILRDTANILEKGGQPCNLTEDELDDVWDGLNNQPVSKEVACAELLHISRSTFNARIAAGVYPEGRHSRNGKGKYWYKQDLIRAEKRRVKNQGK